MEESITHEMGMQVSYCICPKMSQESTVQDIAKRTWRRI